MAARLWQALGGGAARPDQVEIAGVGALPSVFAVSDFAAAAMATAGLAVAEWVGLHAGQAPQVRVDRRLASLWFGFSIAPDGWELPSAWDAVAGDYATADGWIRLHTNARAHRDAALSVLGFPADPVPGREAVAAAVAKWRADALEAAVVAAGGCAAAMRDPEQWAAHPQGRAVLAEPLMHVERQGAALRFSRQVDALRPLSGIRVLDLTRVLAGPVATRFLAGFGADVLRIDPPGWDEGAVIPEVTLGKRCARLDFKQAGDREHLKGLIAEADILVHGYRPDALERLGLGADVRRALNPGLVDVSLDAYGWSGPWAGRRGFDSLVQMSAGIAATGMAEAGAARPVPLPVQALDHGAGYLLAAAAVRGLVLRAMQATGSRWCTSVARVGGCLAGYRQSGDVALIGKPEPHDYDAALEATGWGPARRLRAPLCVGVARMGWDRPAGRLGTAPAAW
ncbi:acyl-CoA transferase [Hoeflea olei]|uniref:Acyl-CoA transferase n=2 Tax=Hoeflea olei TaxID=1480615 RepID=A0A1C1YWY5_9HYPH|nr:acyl-CoA transferase [Hoeflea olei]